MIYSASPDLLTKPDFWIGHEYKTSKVQKPKSLCPGKWIDLILILIISAIICGTKLDWNEKREIFDFSVAFILRTMKSAEATFDNFSWINSALTQEAKINLFHQSSIFTGEVSVGSSEVGLLFVPWASSGGILDFLCF